MSNDPGEEAPRDAVSVDTGTAPSTPALPDDPLASAASRGDDPLGMFATDSDTPVGKAASASPPVQEPGVRAPASEATGAVPDEWNAPAGAEPGGSRVEAHQEPALTGEPQLPFVRHRPDARPSSAPPVATDPRGEPPAQPTGGPTSPGPPLVRMAPRLPVESDDRAPGVGTSATSKSEPDDPLTPASPPTPWHSPVRPAVADGPARQDAMRPVPSTAPPPDWRLSPPARPQPPRRAIPRWLYVVVGLVVVGGLAYAVWSLVPGNQPAAPPAPPEGRLTLESIPTGAQVEIDGVVRGATPLGLRVKAGRHLVRVGGPGGREIDVVVAAGGDVSHHIDLPEMRTRLHIATVPPAAAVWVDGQRRGVAPLDLADLSPGTHAVMVEAGGATVRRDVDVRSGADNSVVISLGGGGPTTGWLTVATPFDVDVYEGSRLVGRSADGQMLLVSGSHELTLTNADLGFKQASSVNVAAGRTATVRVEPVNGQLSVNATPWAEVLLDGDRIGETPIANYTTSIGRHEIVFRHPQFGEQRKTVVVTAASPTRVFATFTK